MAGAVLGSDSLDPCSGWWPLVSAAAAVAGAGAGAVFSASCFCLARRAKGPSVGNALVAATATPFPCG